MAGASIRSTARFMDDDLPVPVGTLCIGREVFYNFITNQHYEELSTRQLASQFIEEMESCGMDIDEAYDSLLKLDSKLNIKKSALKVYACDEPKENPIYRQFNEATRAVLENRASLHSYKFGLFFWLMDDIFEEKNRWLKQRVYRGVNCAFNISLNNRVFTFNQFVSFSAHKREAVKFLNGSGTLFIVDGVHRMSMSRYSPFPSEDEHLVHPNQEFKIMKVIMKNNLAEVHLKCI